MKKWDLSRDLRHHLEQQERSWMKDEVDVWWWYGDKQAGGGVIMVAKLVQQRSRKKYTHNFLRELWVILVVCEKDDYDDMNMAKKKS